MPNSSPTSIRTWPLPQRLDAWRRLREQEPKLFAHDQAERLGISDAELVAMRCGQGVTRLAGTWTNLIGALPELGRVMVLTRNESCVHERKGCFDHIEIGKDMAVVLNVEIDLRIFLKHFAFGFAVEDQAPGRMPSLQFFDQDGRAVHSVYLTEQSRRDAWQGLIARFAAGDQSPDLALTPADDPLPFRHDDARIDVDALRADWKRMYDPHAFFALLRRHEVTPTQAFRLVGPDLARRVGHDALTHVLDKAVDSSLPIMVFVGSPGVVQIHTGPVHNIKQIGPWFNILDPDFNLHLRSDHIAESWIVKKPSPMGELHSLELYDAQGAKIAQLYGQREPDKSERGAWRELVDGLPSLDAERA